MKKRFLPVAATLGAALAMAPAAQAYSVNFGCTKDSRSIAATAYYSANGGSQWNVSSLAYSYANTGNKTNSSFSVTNGSNATAWAWSTPDDRTTQGYTKSVGVNIARGQYAAAHQTTHFDVFGNDPSCTGNGNF